jgi:branched-chain amino acid transport system permease protein
MYALVGGIGSFAGPIIGTVILVLIPNFASQLKGYLPFVSAVILLIIAYLMPQGLVGLPQAIRNRRSRGRNRALSTGTQ